jgi:glycosyltransferase involved in cell wall biosynthesis
MKFSIITPTCNRPKLLSRAIRSVLAQSHTDFELIIVNDSPDNDAYEKKLREFDDPRIRYFKNSKNEGVNASRNRALDAISPDAERIIFLDDDDYLVPNALTNILRILLEARYDWIVTDRATSEGHTLTRAPRSKATYTYAWDYLIRRRMRGDATHCIDAGLINGTTAKIRFATAIRQAEEWIFFFELNLHTPFYYEHITTTLTEGYMENGLNNRRRSNRETWFTLRGVLAEARGRNFFILPSFWIYFCMRLVRMLIK